MRKKLVVLFALFALLGAGACTPQNDADDDTDTAADTELGDDEFRLVGTVIEARHRAQPEGGLPEEVAPETADEAESDADTDDDPNVGGIAIRPENEDDAEGLEDCETTQDSYVAYYVDDTTFDPEDTVDDEEFPVGLAGQTLDVEGRIFTADAEGEDAEATDEADASPDAEESPEASPGDDDAAVEGDACILVLDEVEVVEDEEADTDTDTTDGTGTGGTDQGEGADGEPAATASASPDPDATADPDATPPTGGAPGGIFEGEASPDPCEGRKACAEKEAEGELPE